MKVANPTQLQVRKAGDNIRHNRDVCLLLEGTYPYVFGGVSAWVDQILHAMPERKFDLTFIGSCKEANGKTKYKLASNIGTIHEIYLQNGSAQNFRFTRKTRVRSQDVIDLVKAYLAGGVSEPLDVMDAACDLASRCSLRDFWELPETWELLQEIYENNARAYSFKEFYWNIWNFVSHLWALLGSADKVPEAPVYHSVCTGYAGMLGALLKHRRGGKLLLSEHGIYVKERIEDLRTANWIADPGERVPALGNPGGVLTDLWMQFFLFQARVSYRSADQIISLFDRNADMQVEFGADQEKIRIIPNGVASAEEATVAGCPEARRRPTIGFLGRIVPVKDIFTLLRAMPIVLTDCPSAELLIAGPTDEDSDYHVECLDLARRLGLEDSVRFIGKVSPNEFFPDIDVMVLTSLSEGLPFALLEALAFGIPSVVTDVGACRELIEGHAENSSVCGSAGIVTSVAEPEQTGSALLRLLKNSSLRQEYGEIGRRRAANDYALNDVVSAYQKLYDS